MTALSKRILGKVRTIGVENMYEERPRNGSPGFVAELKKLLPAINAPYPDGCYVGKKGRYGNCDLVFDGNWIEVKFAWTYLYADETRPNKAFYKHLLGDDSECALKDVRLKLPALLGKPDVKTIAFLLVCFESDARPLDKNLIAELEIRGGLAQAPWRRHALRRWRNPLNPRGSISAYFWERPA